MVCPLWPLHYVFQMVVLFAVWDRYVIGSKTSESPFKSSTNKGEGEISSAAAIRPNAWNISFFPNFVDKLPEGKDFKVTYDVVPPDGQEILAGDTFQVEVENKEIATVISGTDIYIVNKTEDFLTNVTFTLRGVFLGFTKFRVRGSRGNQVDAFVQSEDVAVSVVRMEGVLDKVFIISLIILMTLNYVNMGCTLDLEVVEKTVRRPIGPVVGVCSQYLFMPLISFGLSYLIFTDPTLRLGLFTTGCSPGGGASNVWTYLLMGNLDLSITMTFFSNVLAFAMMPLWLFTLGQVLFRERNITIPYKSIMYLVVMLVVPVGIGLLLQRYRPRIAAFCKKILGPFSIFMIIWIIAFGAYANLYMFHLFSWQVAVAGLSVAWLGYLFGGIAAVAFRFPIEDVIAVAVETGVQNTGIAIGILKLTLPQPDADITSVVPVATATMMPWPLLVAYVIIRIKNRSKTRYTMADSKEINGTESTRNIVRRSPLSTSSNDAGYA